MRGNMRAAVSRSCLLLAFELGCRSEPEFVGSTVRPARMVAHHLFIFVHVMCSKRPRSLRYHEILGLFLMFRSRPSPRYITTFLRFDSRLTSARKDLFNNNYMAPVFISCQSNSTLN
jgi:hypothetical protein